MVSEYIAPFRKVSDKKIVYNTKFRNSWSPKPSGGTINPQGKPIGNTRGLNKPPIIKSTARIGNNFGIKGMVRDPIQVRMDLKHRLDPKTMKRLDQLRGIGEIQNSVRKPIGAYAAHMAKAAKISKGINIAGLALAAGEGIYKGTKRALGPGGTQFHTGTGVPLWEDRNTENIGSKLNY